MRELSVERLTPGLTIASNVYLPGETRGLPLVAANVVVTEALRQRLLDAGVHQVFVDDALSDGIEDDPITQDTRMAALSTVRTSFETLRTESAVLSESDLLRIEGIIGKILTEISHRQRTLVCLSDLNLFGGGRMQHAVNVCVVGCAIARRYLLDHGWLDYKGVRRMDHVPDRLVKLGIGLILMDVGSLQIPDAVWKKEGMWTADERKLVHQHPLLGIDLVRPADLSPLSTVVIAQHHERFDGSGYPRGLAGEQLHDHGQIAAIADAFVSMVSPGTHGQQPKSAPLDAWTTIGNAAGTLFNPLIVEAFSQAIAPISPGAAVRLDNGSYALVEWINDAHPIRPRIRITHGAAGEAMDPPESVDLAVRHDLSIVDVVDGLPSDAVHARR